MARLLSHVIYFLLLSSTCLCLPTTNRPAQVKRSVGLLNSSYDYIVVGGGTAGLTVANRLTEHGDKSVLVIEYGYIDDSEDLLIPERVLAGNARDVFNWTTVPQPGLNNRTSQAGTAAVLGGGSAVNGMLFDRGSVSDYDAWEELGNPGWGWYGLLPYFKKSVTFTPPSASIAAQYNYTYDISSAYGDGPVHASFPPYQWPSQGVFWGGWADLGIQRQQEGANGSAYGVFWIPSSLDPVTQTRSYARTAHYDPIKSRSNYHLLTGYTVTHVTFAYGLTACGVSVQSRDSNTTTIIKARKEIILSAGAMGTPQILQRSGIGPKALLNKAGIKVKRNLPGVGQNFQDHPASQLTFYIVTKNFFPNPDAFLANATFNSDSFAEYEKFKTGPYTMSHVNAAGFIPLKSVNPDYELIISTLKSQNATAYLPETYDETLIAGFLSQRSIVASQFSASDNGAFEFPFSGAAAQAALHKPLSRGTVSINTTNPLGDPVIDYGVFTNPVDVANSVAMIKFVRKFYATPSIRSLGPVETFPGANIISDADIENVLRSFLMYPSFAHPSCTCAMLPLGKGGVVGPDLRVYGTQGLSIADASIIPLIPATHLQATIYAIAEKAADLIKARAWYFP
ncbi:GMC oxidoreductase [Glonium stellatum]|uniref:GMC oxidoreductase n=1 Tax=Glonium stellatum TaxID=574774 RepID=A0A8E2FDQ6_9PEZI|nr:GMC oxidoreductase [Glonium stellatum]